MVSFQKVFWSKIAVAGHGTRYLFRLTFSPTISIFAILLSQCLFAKLWKKTHITQMIVCRLIVSVLQTNSVLSRFLLLSFQVEWSCAFSKHQEVKFFLQWSGEGQKSVTSMSSDICNFCTCATGCQKFSDIRYSCFQSPLFPYHVTKKRQALGTRMRSKLNDPFSIRGINCLF